ncbi:MAG: hypothetical protein GF405_11150 [Candidatus Eisenbacteria bacterium]|nr:hypothetical protein [Candidatus Eisenbacteria bacterium]
MLSRFARPSWKLTALVATVATLAAGCARELPSDGRGLPYDVVEIAPEQTVVDVDIVDFDGDGVDEVADIRRSSGHPYYFLSIRRIRNGNLVPMVQRPGMQHFRRGGTADVDGDGLPEYFISQRVGDRAFLTPFSVRITGSAAQIDTLRSARPIALSLKDYVDDTSSWDGRLFVFGTFDLDEDGFRETVLFGCSVGYVGVPRGIGRANLRTGRIDWFRRFSGCPVPGGERLDVDADGRDELVAGLGAPGNSVTWNGRTDSTAYLVAVDLDGQLLWETRTGGLSARTEMLRCDLDEDGEPELLTWTHYGITERPDSLGVFLRDPADGQVVAGWSSGAMVNHVATADLADGPAVFAATDDGWLRRLRYVNGRLLVDRAVRTPARGVERSAGAPEDGYGQAGEEPGGDGPSSGESIASASQVPEANAGRAEPTHPAVASVAWLRLAPVPSPVVCIGTRDGVVAVLDVDLEPLALHRGERAVGRWGFFSHVSESGIREAVVRTSDGYFVFGLAEVPPSPWAFVLVGLVGLAGAGACVPKVRRVSASTLRRWLTPAPERERLIDGLLNDLAVAGHGELTATSALRRLKDVLILMHPEDGRVPDAFLARYGEAAADLRGIGVPTLQSILRQAELAALSPGIVEDLRAAVMSVTRASASLKGRPPDRREAVELTKTLDSMFASLDAALRALRDECRLELSSPVMDELRRAARVHADSYVDEGAELRIPAASPHEEVRVLGTRPELSFVLENLIANALAAVRSAPVRRVEVDVEAEDGTVVVRVSDTGGGVPPGVRDRLFERGVTSKKNGGGTGLAGSREILERRGGSIRLVDSDPDRGTTFEVRFEVC